MSEGSVLDSTTRDDINDLDDQTATLMPLSFLCKLITPFNGDRDEVENFLLNAKHAHEFAQPNQVLPLFAYTLSQISSKVKNQLNLSEITNFHALKEALKRLYVDQTHYTQLMEDLDTIKQKPNETVTDYYTRLEKLTSRCLSAVKTTNGDPDLLRGKTAFIKDTALRRFIFHTHPEISRVLRIHRNLDNLNEAFSVARSEEKALQMYRKSSSGSSSDSKYCKNCKSKSHFTKDCRHKSNPSNNTERQFNGKTCNYCKNKGHEISECRKKKYNDEKRNAQNPTNPRVNHLNSKMSELSVATSDNCIKSTQAEILMLD